MEQFINQDYVSIKHKFNNIPFTCGLYNIQLYYGLDLDFYGSFANVFNKQIFGALHEKFINIV